MSDRRSAFPFLHGGQPAALPPGTRATPSALVYLFTLLAIIGLAGWLYLQQASQAATYAREISDLSLEKEQLHRDIVALRAQVAELGSWDRILRVGEEYGYALVSSSDAGRYWTLTLGDTVGESAGEPGAPGGRGVDEVLSTDGPIAELVSRLAEWLRSSRER